MTRAAARTAQPRITRESSLASEARVGLFGDEVPRNARCPCGSGRRFKSCCGSFSTLGSSPGSADIRDRLWRALQRQQAGALAHARTLYEEVLEEHGELPDAVHMLGVIMLQMGHYREAVGQLLRAAELFDWELVAARHNLGLALAAELGGRSEPVIEQLWQAYDAMLDARRAGASSVDIAPRVSVVVPSFNHGRYVEDALDSISIQSYRSIEIVVIDDGSSDDSEDRILGALRRSPFPWQFHARGNCGAAATFNEAIRSSHGAFVNILNSNDRFAPSRLATMVDAIARAGEQWGFSRVALIDDDGAAVAADASPLASDLTYLMDHVGASDTVGWSFLSGNPSISAGSVFFSRALFDRLGGFRDFHYHHDWDFCLRASLIAEPVFVASAEYDYRVHAGKTILEPVSDAQHEVDAMFMRFHRDVAAAVDLSNRFAPAPQVWGNRFFEQALGSGHAEVMSPETLRDLGARVLALPRSPGNR